MLLLNLVLFIASGVVAGLVLLWLEHRFSAGDRLLALV